MTIIKRSAFALAINLLALLASSQAQTPRMTTVNITAESGEVRIAAQGDVSEMRIEISDESGEVVFQSGAITGQQLEWEMKDAQGERVPAGTYLVTVTFRNAAGKLRKRVEQVTVDEVEQSSTQPAAAPQAVQETVTASSAGVFGTIARFTGTSTIANSIITQTTTGKIGISASDPKARLEVAGNWTGEDGALRLSGDKPTIRFAGGSIAGNQSWIMHLGSNGPGNLEFHRRNGPHSRVPWTQVMSLTPAGNVGIGTPYPTANLHVQSGGSFAALKLEAGEGAGASTGSWRIQADNGLDRFGSAFVIYSDTTQRYGLIIDSSGRVGIGTPYPPGAQFNVYAPSNLTAVYGNSESGTGVVGSSTTGYAGQFYGDVQVKGDLYIDGTINPPSDRNMKTNFSTVNPRLILDKLVSIPIQTWRYRSESNAARHIGPAAQDFRAAFNLGADDKHISTVDADGVALASIQGLYQMMREKDRQIESLTHKVERQQAQLNQVKRTIKRKRTARRS